MSTRVLMLGPGDGVGGGISALSETIVPALRQRVDLLYLPTVEHRLLSESGRVSARNVSGAASQYIRFLWVVRRFRPQIVHIHTSQGLGWLKDTFYVLASRACRCQVVLHMHGGYFLEMYNRSHPLMQHYTRTVCRLADAIVEVSTERSRQLGEIASPERIVALRNCIDTAAFLPSVQRGAAGTVYALFLGAVGMGKGTFDLLDAMAILHTRGCPLRLWIAGHEEAPGDIARARDCLGRLGIGDVCQLLGTVRGLEKSRLLGEAGLLVLPSYREAMPMSILEAMAAGLAVVSTPVGGIPEVVRDGYNGYLVPPGDVEALAEKLAILADDPQLRQAMGRRGREIAERELDVKPYIAQLSALYESLAGAA